MPANDILVSVADLLAEPCHRVVIDASWIYPPFNAAKIDVRQRYLDAHIPGALFLDLEHLGGRYETAPDVPAIRPPGPTALKDALGALAIGAMDPIVVTDMDGGVTTAPFARLALLDAGFADVRLLDGGTPAWLAAGHAVTAAEPRVLSGPNRPETTVDGRFGHARPADMLVDAREFDGNTPVLPRRFADATLPDAVRIRPSEVIDDTGAAQRFSTAPTLHRLADARGLRDGAQVTVACYFGVGAAVVATALEIAGFAAPRVDAGWVFAPAAGGDRRRGLPPRRSS